MAGRALKSPLSMESAIASPFGPWEQRMLTPSRLSTTRVMLKMSLFVTVTEICLCVNNMTDSLLRLKQGIMHRALCQKVKQRKELTFSGEAGESSHCTMRAGERQKTTALLVYT